MQRPFQLVQPQLQLADAALELLDPLSGAWRWRKLLGKWSGKSPWFAQRRRINYTGGNVVGGIGALLVPVTAAAFGWVIAVSSGAIFAVIGALLWLGVRADRSL